MLTVYSHDVQPSDLPALFLTHGLGLVHGATEATLKKRINGDWCLTMQVPAGGQDAELLQSDRLIAYQGQLYRILRRKPDWRRGKNLINIEAPHIIYDLREMYIVNIETKEDDRYPDGINARQALEQILEGTPFQAGDVDVDTDVLDYLDVLQKDRMTAIKEQLLELWGGELQPDNFTLHLRKQLGVDRRFPLRHARNIEAITCTEDIEPVVTRLHVRGYQATNFEDINDGKDYIDSELIGRYSHVRESYIDFEDVDDPAELLRMGVEKLHELETPQVTWDIQLKDMRAHGDYRYYRDLETFELGDTACLHHPLFGQDLILRMTELDHDALRGVHTRVVLGNAKDILLGSMQSLYRTAETVNSLVTTQGRLKAEKIEGGFDFARLVNLDQQIAQVVSQWLTAGKFADCMAGMGELLLMQSGGLYSLRAGTNGANAKTVKCTLGTADLKDKSLTSAKLDDKAVKARAIDLAEIFQSTEGNQKIEQRHLVEALSNQLSDAYAGACQLWSHARTASGVHAFAGQGMIGRAKLTAAFVSGDSVTVNGKPVTAYSHGNALSALPAAGRWVTFVYDATAATLDF